MVASTKTTTVSIQPAWPNLPQVAEDIVTSNRLWAVSRSCPWDSSAIEQFTDLVDRYGVFQVGGWNEHVLKGNTGEVSRAIKSQLSKALVARIRDMTPELAERHQERFDRMTGRVTDPLEDAWLGNRELAIVDETMGVFFPEDLCYHRSSYYPGPGTLSQQVFLIGAFFGKIPWQWRPIIPRFMRYLDSIGYKDAQYDHRKVIKQSTVAVINILGTAFSVGNRGCWLEERDIRRLRNLNTLFAAYPHIPEDTSHRWAFIRQHVTDPGRLDKQYGITPDFLEGAKRLGFIRD